MPSGQNTHHLIPENTLENQEAGGNRTERCYSSTVTVMVGKRSGQPGGTMKSNSQDDASGKVALSRELVIFELVPRMEFGVVTIDPGLLLLDSNCNTAACNISDCNSNSFLTCGVTPQ
jgi:hypothetical protein